MLRRNPPPAEAQGLAWTNVACDFYVTRFDRHESVTFSRTSIRDAASVRAGSSIMIGLVRAATLCATLALGLVTAQAADKAFKRDDLADSAVKLEAQIKSEAGAVAKSGASLRTDADAAFRRSDFRSGLQILGQLAVAAPRACFTVTEDPAKATDFAPFLALAGSGEPALTSEGKQLCVDGLKHGERYDINLRAGLPSTVKETLPKSAEFNVYVRARKPFVRFTGRAYLLPRTAQPAIPLASVNTSPLP